LIFTQQKTVLEEKQLMLLGKKTFTAPSLILLEPAFPFAWKNEPSRKAKIYP